MVAKRTVRCFLYVYSFTLAQFNMVAKLRIIALSTSRSSFTLAQFNMVAKLFMVIIERNLRFTLAQFNMVAKPQIYSIILS